MPESVVVVQGKGGSYVQGAGVALGFSDGVTDSVYVDSDREAVIEHRTTGQRYCFCKRARQRFDEDTSPKARFI